MKKNQFFKISRGNRPSLTTPSAFGSHPINSLKGNLFPALTVLRSYGLMVFLLMATTLVFAVPAIPTPVKMTQPNGEELTVLINGDERMNWYESMDGYTILYNRDGFLTYAQLDENGDLQPSEVIATDINKRNIVATTLLNRTDKKLFYSDLQRQLMLQVWQIEDEVVTRGGDRGVTGTFKTLCALVQFTNKAFTFSLNSFEGLMNQLGYSCVL